MQLIAKGSFKPEPEKEPLNRALLPHDLSVTWHMIHFKNDQNIRTFNFFTNYRTPSFLYMG